MLWGIKCRSLNFFSPLSFPALSADWHPRHVEVRQEGTAVTVTFDLAPPSLGIRSYFSLCYANGMKKYIDIMPVSGPHLHTLLLCSLSAKLFVPVTTMVGKSDARVNLFVFLQIFMSIELLRQQNAPQLPNGWSSGRHQLHLWGKRKVSDHNKNMFHFDAISYKYTKVLQAKDPDTNPGDSVFHNWC